VGAGAPIDAYGVGTRMGVSADAPYLDSAYKLVAFAGRPVMKLSAGKVTSPGAKQVWRGSAAAGDLLALREETGPPAREPLLAPVMAGGRRIGDAGGVPAARTRLEADLAWLPDEARRLRQPTTVTVHASEQLSRLTERLRRQLVAG
jgi:nicotinate phosphoribosyltransferase